MLSVEAFFGRQLKKKDKKKKDFKYELLCQSCKKYYVKSMSLNTLTRTVLVNISVTAYTKETEANEVWL